MDIFGTHLGNLVATKQNITNFSLLKLFGEQIHYSFVSETTLQG